MAKFSVELLLEIEAPNPDDAAALALLAARTTADSERHWRGVVVDCAALETSAAL